MITKQQVNIAPEADYVFNYKNDKVYKINMLLTFCGYHNINKGTTWSLGGIRHLWGVPFTLNNGYPDTSGPGTVRERQEVNLCKELTMDATPNPFNSITQLQIGIPTNERNGMMLNVSDISGRLVVKIPIHGTGYKTIRLDRKLLNQRSMATGLYIVKLVGTTKTITKKLILLR